MSRFRSGDNIAAPPPHSGCRGLTPSSGAERVKCAADLGKRLRYGGRLSVEAIARQVAMSPSHFAHRVRVAARMSPMRFVKEVRLDAARTLLLSDGVRASEVALRVGYESPAHFSRDFKRRLGPRQHVTPGALAKEVAKPTFRSMRRVMPS